MYEYEWTHGGLASAELVEKLAAFYSEQYGAWGNRSPRAGERIKLSAGRVRDLLISPDSRIAWATLDREIVGYAIAVQTKVPRYGIVSWVTQLVVHELHRHKDVGKTLLFSIWRFTDHFAWGLISANPYAVRALEKATRRRCLPGRIKKHRDPLLNLGKQSVSYVKFAREIRVNRQESRIDTEFFLDHSSLQEMLSSVISQGNPWQLGNISDGWEWFAFTFQDQPQISLTRKELDEMLLASDGLTQHAYSRMLMKQNTQRWATFSEPEVEFVIKNCALEAGNAVVDFGCGTGRHVVGLASRGIRAVGIDYVIPFIDTAWAEAAARHLDDAEFRVADCRDVDLAQRFDAAICLYDVIGSYADEQQNARILTNLARHVKTQGYVLLSVMNMELTERIARYRFSIETEPDKLLQLKPSRRMEKTGEVFNPEYYLIEENTRVVYRKEQFTEGKGLPEELLVRDRRYTQPQIEQLCVQAGLDVIWSHFVKAGGWASPLPREDDRAKEILVLCQKRA
jgi:2-polyprenyl-3-methyl-5-hydroxy-6-metoxy-1,4-benzoquinol methylase